MKPATVTKIDRIIMREEMAACVNHTGGVGEAAAFQNLYRFKTFWSSGFDLFRVTWYESHDDRADVRWYLHALDFQNLINDDVYLVETRMLEECEHGNFYLDIFRKLKKNILATLMDTDIAGMLQLCANYVTVHDSHPSSLAAVYSCKII